MKHWLISLLSPLCLIAANDASVLRLLNTPGHIAIARHALAPGTGDPATFDLEDCTTQRNLSVEGRVQARAMGESLRKNGIANAHIFTSQWCRCKDTASLLGFGEVTELPSLNSFFETPHRREPQMKALRTWLREERPKDKPVLLITHQVVITALTGVFPSSGETLVLKETQTGWEVVGRVKADASTP
jgi:broad specificity phosphatase PhoE